MSRYIDIDDISLRKTISVGGLSAKALWRRIQQEPSIDIVRCKECKYAEVADPTDDQDGYICQFHRGSIWFSGSYCSWGERKEGE